MLEAPTPQFVILALSYIAFVALGWWAIGAPSRSRPECRKCRADLRGSATDANGAPRCPTCSRDLGRWRAIRLRGRRRRSTRALVAGLVAAVLAAGISIKDAALQREYSSWGALLPTAWLVDGLKDDTDWQPWQLAALVDRGSTGWMTSADARWAIDELSVARGGLAKLPDDLLESLIDIAEPKLDEAAVIAAVEPPVLNARAIALNPDGSLTVSLEVPNEMRWATTIICAWIDDWQMANGHRWPGVPPLAKLVCFRSWHDGSIVIPREFVSANTLRLGVELRYLYAFVPDSAIDVLLEEIRQSERFEPDDWGVRAYAARMPLSCVVDPLPAKEPSP